jgi:hypothetical protein
VRGFRFVLITTVVIAGCTQAPAGREPPSSAGVPPESPSTEPPGARLPDGSALPGGCTGGAAATDIVAFYAEGRAWALDPDDGSLACLFPVENPGPFAWGPQGDRVVLGRFEIKGVGAEAPDLPPVRARLRAFDWGHPLGLAVAFADREGDPWKRFVDDGHVERLASLPRGAYLEVAYHPSGLALAFVVEDDDGEAIWLSTNEGKDPQRLVFSDTGTEFTSLAFSPNGKQLWWTAQHPEGYPELHWMQLDDRTGFATGWRGDPGTVADHLMLAPSGPLKSVNEGNACAERRALILLQGASQPALPDEGRPTEAVGWLDPTTLLVAAGGCGQPRDLYAVDARSESEPAALVFGVELAAARTQVTNPPHVVPAPSGDKGPPLSGVG